MEVTLLIWIAQQTSLLFTVGLTIVTGFLGVKIAKRQGLRAWINLQQGLTTGKTPTDSVLEAILILVAGVVLLTPGVITDVIGFLLLVPPVRGMAGKLLKGYFQNRVNFKMSGFPTGTGFPFPTSQNTENVVQEQDDENVIDVEFTRKDAEEN